MEETKKGHDLIQNWKFPFQSVGHSISRCMWHVLSAYVRENPGLQQLNVNSTPIKMKHIWNSKCCFKYLYPWQNYLICMLVTYSLSKCFAHIFQRDKETFWQFWHIFFKTFLPQHQCCSINVHLLINKYHLYHGRCSNNYKINTLHIFIVHTSLYMYMYTSLYMYMYMYTYMYMYIPGCPKKSTPLWFSIT